jgi:hypothetical protein
LCGPTVGMMILAGRDKGDGVDERHRPVVVGEAKLLLSALSVLQPGRAARFCQLGGRQQRSAGAAVLRGYAAATRPRPLASVFCSVYSLGDSTACSGNR